MQQQVNGSGVLSHHMLYFFFQTSLCTYGPTIKNRHEKPPNVTSRSGLGLGLELGGYSGHKLKKMDVVVV